MPDDHLDAISRDATVTRWRASLTDSEPASAWVFDTGGAVVGFARVGDCIDPDTSGAGELWDLWVHPEHRGLGIGAALFDVAMQDLATRHRAAVIWVLRDNAGGRRFYERHGAQLEGLTRTEPVSGGTMTDVRYVVDLRSLPHSTPPHRRETL